MRRPRSAARWILPAGILALSASLVRAEILEEIVAKINNSIITTTQFEERLEVYRQQLARKYPDEDLSTRMEAATDNLLRNMIMETLLVQRADVILDMDKVKKNLLEDFKKQQKIENDEELDRLLKEQKMSRSDLLETLVRLSVPQEIINYEVRRKISVSDKEIKKYYEEHRKDFTKPERVVFREIVVLFEDATKEEARSRAEGIRRELDGGAEFGEVAARESGVSSKERGGLVGPFTRGELRPEIESQVFALQPGLLAGPIESSRAFHIVRLETKEGEEVTALAEAQDPITEKIRDSRFKESLEAYLERLWKENYIHVFPKFGSSEWKPTDTLEGAPGSGP